MLKNAALIVAFLVLNSVSLASQVSAMPVTMHEMGGMSHNTSDSTTCATQCRTAVLNQEESSNSRHDKEDDDEPIVPFYIQNQDWQFSKIDVNEKLYSDSVKPPPKIPIYILYVVFRV